MLCNLCNFVLFDRFQHTCSSSFGIYIMTVENPYNVKLIILRQKKIVESKSAKQKIKIIKIKISKT